MKICHIFLLKMDYKKALMNNSSEKELPDIVMDYDSDEGEEETPRSIEIRELRKKARNPDITDYILFVLKDCNFQSRIALVPYNEFLKVRSEEYNFIKRCGNIIVIPLVFEGNIGSYGKTDITDVDHLIKFYTEPPVDGCYLDEKDFIWSENCIYNPLGMFPGFNHYQNYERLKKMTKYKGRPVNIVDSYLFLEHTINLHLK